MNTTAIVHTIAGPLANSLLSIHPNDATRRPIPALWSQWWAWAEDTPDAWLRLLRSYHARPALIPPTLRTLIDAVRSLQLERAPSAAEASTARAHRISPKKAHEIARMSAYVDALAHADSPRAVWHAVDVGAGQGHLSRALQTSHFRILALDSDENQTAGARRWASTVAHQTVHVGPQTLDEAITAWLGHPPEPVPVTLVALHACGSLSVDVIRAFLSRSATKGPWVPHSLVVVGCCYNRMSLSGKSSVYLGIHASTIPDFPLSRPLKDWDPVPRLTIAALHLAAQVPAQWLKDDDAMHRAELAVRKVVYRALLQPVLDAATAQLNAAPSGKPIQPGLGETLENRRLGKLNDKAYQDWPTFLECATAKLAIDLTAINASLPDWLVHETARLKMERALFALQTLRCILGPLIETLIILDRRDWIQQELAEMNDGGRGVEVEMVNLFDQSTGSGRNVALVVRPTTKSEQSLG